MNPVSAGTGTSGYGYMWWVWDGPKGRRALQGALHRRGRGGTVDLGPFRRSTSWSRTRPTTSTGGSTSRGILAANPRARAGGERREDARAVSLGVGNGGRRHQELRENHMTRIDWIHLLLLGGLLGMLGQGIRVVAELKKCQRSSRAGMGPRRRTVVQGQRASREPPHRGSSPVRAAIIGSPTRQEALKIGKDLDDRADRRGLCRHGSSSRAFIKKVPPCRQPPGGQAGR